MPLQMRVARADNGFDVPLHDLMRTGEQPLLWSVDERLRLIRQKVPGRFSVGDREVRRLKLASGRQLELPASQQILKIDGWAPVPELATGSRIAVLRRLDEPTHPQRMYDSEVIMLAHMIGDGSCVRRQPIRYASIDEANLAAVTIAAAHFGITSIRDEYAAARVTTLRLPAPYRLNHGKRNPIAEWLDGLGLFGLRSYEKFVPTKVFGLPDEQVAAKHAYPRQRFIDHYETQRKSLRDIAHDAGVSRQTMARLADDYKIDLRDVGRTTKHAIERDWLYTEYVTHGRPLPDLACEHGVSTSTMARWARTYAIPLRFRGGARNGAGSRAG